MNGKEGVVRGPRRGAVLVGRVRGAILALASVASVGCGPSRPSEVVTAVNVEQNPPAAPSVAAPPRTCAGATSFARSLRDDLSVEAYVTRGLPELDAYVDGLTAALERYRAAAPNRFSYHVDVASSAMAQQAAKDQGLVEQAFGEAKGDDTASVKRGYMGVVLTYRGERETIKFLAPNRRDGVELWLVNKMRDLVAKAEKKPRRVGVLVGTDEVSISETNLIPVSSGTPSIRKLAEQYFDSYRLEDVNLQHGTAEVDPTLDGLLVTQPGRDLDERELRRLDQFVMNGKSVVVVASAVNVKAGDYTMNATLDAHGLDRWLVGYGIRMNRDVVLDFGDQYKVDVMASDGVRALTFPPLPIIEVGKLDDHGRPVKPPFPAFLRLEDVAMPFASSLELDAARQPEVPAGKLVVVARTTTTAAHESGPSAELKPFRRWSPSGSWSSFAVAATVSGTLRSAFPTGDTLGVVAPPKSRGLARVLVISSSQFLANPLARAATTPHGASGVLLAPVGDEQLEQMSMPYAQTLLSNTILAFKNMLDWMTMSEELAACAPIEL